MLKPTSQCSAVLAHMKKFGGITTMEAFGMLRVTRLSERIRELKAQGYKIVTFDEEGGGKRWVRYVLVQEETA